MVYRHQIASMFSSSASRYMGMPARTTGPSIATYDLQNIRGENMVDVDTCVTPGGDWFMSAHTTIMGHLD